MKVTTTSPLVRAALGSALLVALSATLTLAAPLDAGAATRAKTITRTTILARAQSWVKHRVPYSQSRYHRGYRQDCSGFVSMAWSLGRSYSTRTLPSVAKRVPVSKARPGDAVLRPGHVVIFGGWKNRKARTFYAYEQRTWGKVATKRVQRMAANARVLRRPGIRPASNAVAAVDAPNRAAASWGNDGWASGTSTPWAGVTDPIALPTVEVELTAPPAAHPV